MEAPGHLPRLRVPVEFPSYGIGSVLRDARPLEGEAVGDGEVAPDGGDDDRVLGRGPVEVPPGGVALLGELRVVLLVAGDPLPLRRIPSPLGEPLLDVGDGPDAGLLAEVDAHHPPRPGGDDVAVGVDEPRYHRPPREVDDDGVPADQVLDLIVRAHGEDPPELYGDRLLDRFFRIHGHDLAVGESHVGVDSRHQNH